MKEAPVHDDNDWGISCDDGGEEDGSVAAAADVEIASQLAEGVELQYMRKEAEDEDEVATEQRVETKGQSVAEMMAALKASQQKK